MNARQRPFPWWHELALLVLIITLLVVAESLLSGFLGLRGQLILSRRLWEFAILALAMTPIIITAGIDLSVGSAMGLCAVAFGVSFAAWGNPWLSCGAALVAGTLGGMINGLMVAWLRVHPLIVTLATYAAFRGIAEGVSQGKPYSRFGESFAAFGRWTIGGVPFAGYLFALLAVVMAVMLAKSRWGRSLYAIGHSERAARFSGIAVARIQFWLYTLAGLFAGLATIIYVARFDTAKADAGRGFELNVITAVVVGGTSVFGGRGNIVGTVLGLLLIHETRLFVGRYWQIDELKSITVGVLLIGAIVLSRFLSSEEREE